MIVCNITLHGSEVIDLFDVYIERIAKREIKIQYNM